MHEDELAVDTDLVRRLALDTDLVRRLALDLVADRTERIRRR